MNKMDISGFLHWSYWIRYQRYNNIVGLVDKFNFFYTCGLTLLFMGSTTLRQSFIGRPLHCRTPAHYSTNWVDYAHEICWTNNVFHKLNYNTTEKSQQINYCKWIWLFLLGQTMLAQVPYMFWIFSAKRFGDLIALSVNTQIGNVQAQEKTVAILKAGIQEHDREFASHLNWPSCTRGCRSILVFLLSRFVCIGTIVLQILMMRLFLKLDSAMFGWHLLYRLLAFHGSNSSNYHKGEDAFPTMAFCHFTLRKWKPNVLETETLQCALSASHQLEVQFTALWIWFATMLVWTIVDTSSWLLRLPLILRSSLADKTQATLSPDMKFLLWTAVPRHIGRLITADIATAEIRCCSRDEDLDSLKASTEVGHNWSQKSLISES